MQTPQTRWDAANLRSVSSKLRVEERAEFAASCSSEGVTVYQAIRAFALAAAADPALIRRVCRRRR